MQRTKSGAQYVRRRQEKSTAIIVAIIVVFFVCHVFRLSFRIYEMGGFYLHLFVALSSTSSILKTKEGTYFIESVDTLLF